ncbi:hypothetical protein HK102_002954 [Quaeritorhiza haematococci]|nr:hypothetical protein HK102_002954 [Quaeritorhiza haematococci]
MSGPHRLPPRGYGEPGDRPPPPPHHYHPPPFMPYGPPPFFDDFYDPPFPPHGPLPEPFEPHGPYFLPPRGPYPEFVPPPPWDMEPDGFPYPNDWVDHPLEVLPPDMDRRYRSRSSDRPSMPPDQKRFITEEERKRLRSKRKRSTVQAVPSNNSNGALTKAHNIAGDKQLISIAAPAEPLSPTKELMRGRKAEFVSDGFANTKKRGREPVLPRDQARTGLVDNWGELRSSAKRQRMDGVLSAVEVWSSSPYKNASSVSPTKRRSPPSDTSIGPAHQQELKRLYVDMMPTYFTDQDLEKVFRRFPSFVRAAVAPRSAATPDGPFGSVDFETHEAAAAAFEAMKGHPDFMVRWSNDDPLQTVRAQQPQQQHPMYPRYQQQPQQQTETQPTHLPLMSSSVGDGQFSKEPLRNELARSRTTFPKDSAPNHRGFSLSSPTVEMGMSLEKSSGGIEKDVRRYTDSFLATNTLDVDKKKLGIDTTSPSINENLSNTATWQSKSALISDKKATTTPLVSSDVKEYQPPHSTNRYTSGSRPKVSNSTIKLTTASERKLESIEPSLARWPSPIFSEDDGRITKIIFSSYHVTPEELRANLPRYKPTLS